MRAVPKRDSELWHCHHCPHAQNSPIRVPRAVIVINYRHRTKRQLRDAAVRRFRCCGWQPRRSLPKAAGCRVRAQACRPIAPEAEERDVFPEAANGHRFRSRSRGNDGRWHPGPHSHHRPAAPRQPEAGVAEVSQAWRPYRTWAALHRPGPYRSAISASRRRSWRAARRGHSRRGPPPVRQQTGRGLDLLHALDRLARVDSAHRRPVQQPIGSCLGDRPQVLALTLRDASPGWPGTGPGARHPGTVP
jgi:hypothetical protein